ncbi:hypothetical protein DXG01_006191 [Tephrocybe rancida]|nr:hypothetical protein DXG01_006191 [Tephrocybe rancida]
MDANDHLKQQLVSSHSQDPGFGTGLSYMVQREPYDAYVLSKASQGDWFKNLFKHEVEWPLQLQLDTGATVTPAIPKLHEPAHKEIHDKLSMNHVVGAGLTDGECIERIWARHNTLGNSMKGMGPGARHDTLDDHFGFWNWLK